MASTFRPVSRLRNSAICAHARYWRIGWCAQPSTHERGEADLCSDPIDGDGIICDVATGELWPTEHAMVPNLDDGQTGDAQTLILKAIDQKVTKVARPMPARKNAHSILECGRREVVSKQGGAAITQTIAFRRRVGRESTRGGVRRVPLRRNPLGRERRRCPDPACTHQKRLPHVGSNPGAGALSVSDRIRQYPRS